MKWEIIQHLCHAWQFFRTCKVFGVLGHLQNVKIECLIVTIHEIPDKYPVDGQISDKYQKNLRQIPDHPYKCQQKSWCLPTLVEAPQVQQLQRVAGYSDQKYVKIFWLDYQSFNCIPRQKHLDQGIILFSIVGSKLNAIIYICNHHHHLFPIFGLKFSLKQKIKDLKDLHEVTMK